ncbi:MAG: hypothetical protein ACYCXG_11380 [Acidiferrobacter sp.]
MPTVQEKSPHQRGITLMLAILVMLALSFAALGLLYFVRYDAEVSSNVAVHTAAIQASDVGLEDANIALQGLSNFPEALNMSNVAWWYNPPQSVPGPPPRPSVSFWSGCGSAGTCGVAPPVTAGAITYDVEYVVAPSGLPAAVLNGADQGSAPVTSYRTYIAYVNVALPNTGLTALEYHQMNADVEATLRKVQ